MISRRLVVLVPLVFLLGLDAPPTTLQFKQAGFTIAPLQGKPGPDSYPALTMLLPPTDSYSANVKVEIDPYTGSLDDYIGLSNKGFAEENYNLIAETRVDINTVYFEYAGLIQGNPMHWYAKAISRPGHIYLATGTCLAGQWDSVSSSLKACVGSFNADKTNDSAQPK